LLGRVICLLGRVICLLGMVSPAGDGFLPTGEAIYLN